MKKSMMWAVLGLVGFSCVACFGENRGKQAKVEAVCRLFDAMGSQAMYEDTISSMLELQIQQNPAIACYRKVMENGHELQRMIAEEDERLEERAAEK